MHVADAQQSVAALERDPRVRPQDDLFGHVNGPWLERTAIPDDRATHGSFIILSDAAEEQVRDIIEHAAAQATAEGRLDTDAGRIGALFASFMDTDAVEASGITPLVPLVERIDAVTTTDGLVRLLGELVREGIGGVLSVGPWIDRGDPSRYLLHISQSGLGLPDESYYSDAQHESIRQAYVAHMTRMLSLAADAGLPAGADMAEGPAAAAAAIMAFETRLAEAHWDRTANRDAVRTYNLTTAPALRALLPTAPTWFEAIGVEEDRWAEVVVSQPDVLEAVSAALEEVPLSSWRLWLRWKVLRSLAPYLSAVFVEERFTFYGTTLTGAKELRDRWKRGVGLVEGVLGEAVGRIYVEQHYPPEAEAQMGALVDNLLQAYRERIAVLDWMAEETREEALGKLETFVPKIGRPVRWRDHSALEVDAGDLVGNVRRAAAFELAHELGKLSRPVDRDEWFMTPQTVNAYYNPAMNEIVFPAAILQPPFFDAESDPAYNYGGIGAVIGHEIGHGFDDQGSRYDGAGLLRDWWTESDRERFDERATALITQYDGYSPRDLDPTDRVNGGLTVGENIGDLGGVAVAHHAYRLSLGGAEPPVVDGLTGDQRFFLGWARIWRAVSRPEEARRRLTVDPHSPPEFRANVVRNVDAFHEAFGTAEGDGLWLAPDERVAIW